MSQVPPAPCAYGFHMSGYTAFLPDWFCTVQASSEEEAQRIAAENFRKWLAEEPNRVIAWRDFAADSAGDST